MLKVKKKNVIIVASSCLFVLILSFLIPSLRTPFLNLLKQPLNLSTLIQREFNGMLFYHRNFIQNDRLKKEIDYLNNNELDVSKNNLSGHYVEKKEEQAEFIKRKYQKMFSEKNLLQDKIRVFESNLLKNQNEKGLIENDINNLKINWTTATTTKITCNATEFIILLNDSSLP